MTRLKDYDKIGGWLYKTAGNISKQYAASIRKERKRFAAPPGRNGGEAPIDGIIAEPIKSEADRIAEQRAVARAAGEIRKRLNPFDELAFREKHPLKEAAVRFNIGLSARSHGQAGCGKR